MFTMSVSMTILSWKYAKVYDTLKKRVFTCSPPLINLYFKLLSTFIITRVYLVFMDSSIFIRIISSSLFIFTHHITSKTYPLADINISVHAPISWYYIFIMQLVCSWPLTSNITNPVQV